MLKIELIKFIFLLVIIILTSPSCAKQKFDIESITSLTYNSEHQTVQFASDQF